MKIGKALPQPLLIQEGFFANQAYDEYSLLKESSVNWEYNCTYQLLRNALVGNNAVVHLKSIQIANAKREGGMMNEVLCSIDCISVGVIKKSLDKMCLDRIKLHAGDIVFFDDTKALSLMSNDSIEFYAITIPKSLLGNKLTLFLAALNHTIRDKEMQFQNFLDEILNLFLESSTDLEYEKLENKLIAFLSNMLETQTPSSPKLTKAEELAIVIRDRVYRHMDGKISIASLAKEYDVSEKTLQNGFKSLFGFTPTLFLRRLKLNLVRNDLRNPRLEKNIVSRVAHKWGFIHMGRFSSYYKELFGETPSKTLKSTKSLESSIASSCVTRKEEI